MKLKLLTLTSLLFTFSAFAGDLYLICSTNYGSTDQEEVFLVDKSIDVETEVIQDYFYDPQNMDRVIDVTLKTKTRDLAVTIYDVHGGGSRGHIEAQLQINHPVQITENVSCRISD